MIEVLSSAQLSIISIRIHRFPEQSRFARNQQALARVRNVFLQTSCGFPEKSAGIDGQVWEAKKHKEWRLTLRWNLSE